jgi:hypothetical protein
MLASWSDHPDRMAQILAMDQPGLGGSVRRPSSADTATAGAVAYRAAMRGNFAVTTSQHCGAGNGRRAGLRADERRQADHEGKGRIHRIEPYCGKRQR